jgi:glycosyltransferase involved in cell wall biosynthesis
LTPAASTTPPTSAPTLKVLHTYKVYRPEVDGGIPEVISQLTTPRMPSVDSAVLVARVRGLPRRYKIDDVPVTACASLGSLLSMPIAPFYPAAFIRQAAASDVVVHHAPFPLNDIAIAGLSKRVALIVHWHAEILGRTWSKRLLAPAIHHALSRADKIIVSHPRIVDESEFLGPYRDKCIAIPYGVDIDDWATLEPGDARAADELRRRYPRLIVAIGRLVPYKGYAVLLRALQGLDAHLVIFGEGPLLAELTALADSLGISDKVTFAGRRDRNEIKAHLHAARALALASISAAEAFGLVQIEAMAARLPIVNTNIDTAVPTVARDGLEGFTVPCGDADALREALRRLVDDESLAKRLGEAGYQRAREQYSRDSFRTKNLDVYRAASAERRSAL